MRIAPAVVQLPERGSFVRASPRGMSIKEPTIQPLRRSVRADARSRERPLITPYRTGSQQPPNADPEKGSENWSDDRNPPVTPIGVAPPGDR
jgi:hypothetical protein